MPRDIKLTLDRIESRLRDIYSHARIGGYPHAWILEQTRILSNELATRTPAGSRRYPDYVRGFARGIDSVLFHLCQQEQLEFVYCDAEGVLYSTHRGSAHRSTEEFYAAGRGHELGLLPSTHVWKGTSKPFAPFSSPQHMPV